MSSRKTMNRCSAATASFALVAVRTAVRARGARQANAVNRPRALWGCPGQSLWLVGVAIAVLVGAVAIAPSAIAQIGQPRWAKAAPFPHPEEELYGTVVNGKW